MSPFLIAGAGAGAAGLLVFLVIHHIWIRPIWFIAPAGLFIACLGGLAVGWSYAEIRLALPPRPWTFLAVTGLVALILTPAALLAELRPPLVDLAALAIPPENIPRAVLRFATDLLGTAVVMGALLGGLLGRSRQAVLATALAGLVYALGPGHNIPFLGRTPAAGKGLALLLVVTAAAAFVLVEAAERLLKS